MCILDRNSLTTCCHSYGSGVCLPARRARAGLGKTFVSRLGNPARSAGNHALLDVCGLGLKHVRHQHQTFTIRALATDRLVIGCSPIVLGPEFHGQGGPPYMLPSLTDISAGHEQGRSAVALRAEKQTCGFTTRTGINIFVPSSFRKLRY